MARIPSPGLAHHLVALAAGLRTTLRHRRPSGLPEDTAAQRRVWRALASQFSQTEFGRQAGIHRDLTYREFQRGVPLRRYQEIAPAIERMKRGEASVLWPGQCRHFAMSSGTTAGPTKYLPVTTAMLAHFRRTALDSLGLYARRSNSLAVFRGRHLFLGGSTTLTPLSHREPGCGWAGDLSGITAMQLPGWAERHWYEPGRRIAQISDWPDKLRAIAERTRQRDVRLIAGIPSWVLVFAETMRLVTGEPTLRAVWPNLRCLVHGGVPIAPFASQLQEALGPGVDLHEVYPASEAFIAAQDAGPETGLRLFADAGVLYEFLPMDRFDEARLPDLGSVAVPLWQVQPGIDYAILLTTPGGLCRYVIGDVVRFITTDPARLVYVGRTHLQLSAFGEHVIEKELTDALTSVFTRAGLVIANFHVAPRFAEGSSGHNRGRHEWWIELVNAEHARTDTHGLEIELDAQLQRLNDDYQAKRRGGGLSVPIVHLVPAGTFEAWLKQRGRWGGQNKMPRCRSDRLIADELAAGLVEA
jgi:hypothetical protein